jgi:hypothetical protein
MKPTLASGATDLERADMKSDEFLIEAKSTVNASLGVKLDWLIGIADEATAQGKEPALAIAFVDAQGRPHRRGRWVAVEEDLFRRLFPAGIQGEV